MVEQTHRNDEKINKQTNTNKQHNTTQYTCGPMIVSYLVSPATIREGSAGGAVRWCVVGAGGVVCLCLVHRLHFDYKMLEYHVLVVPPPYDGFIRHHFSGNDGG